MHKNRMRAKNRGGGRLFVVNAGGAGAAVRCGTRIVRNGNVSDRTEFRRPGQETQAEAKARRACVTRLRQKMYIGEYITRG